MALPSGTGVVDRRREHRPSRRSPSVIPARFPPLSFPQAFSGNPGSFFCLFICMALTGENSGFPIENVGNDRKGASGMTDGVAGMTERGRRA